MEEARVGDPAGGCPAIEPRAGSDRRFIRRKCSRQSLYYFEAFTLIPSMWAIRFICGSHGRRFSPCEPPWGLAPPLGRLGAPASDERVHGILLVAASNDHSPGHEVAREGWARTGQIPAGVE